MAVNLLVTVRAVQFAGADLATMEIQIGSDTGLVDSTTITIASGTLLASSPVLVSKAISDAARVYMTEQWNLTFAPTDSVRIFGGPSS